MTRAPEVQIVIPVHDPTRQIRRAVESVLQCRSAAAIVVAHGIDSAKLDLPLNERVTVVRVDEGVGYPGIAFNAGLKAGTAPWVGVMGSDDWFQDGALEALITRAESTGSDGVLVPLSAPGASQNVLKPVTLRAQELDPVRDRLFYRTAPLGIFRKEILQSPRYLFAEDTVAGVDQINGIRLWTDGLKISYFRNDPAYVVGDDARTRVTLARRSVSEQAAAWKNVWQDPEVRALPLTVRNALGEKMIRVHVFDWIKRHRDAKTWQPGDLDWLAGLVELILESAPAATLALSSSENAVITSLLERDLGGMQAAFVADQGARFRPPHDIRGLASPTAWPRREIVAVTQRMSDRFRLPKRNRSRERIEHTRVTEDLS